MNIHLYIDAPCDDGQVPVELFEMPFVPPIGTTMCIYPSMLAERYDALFAGHLNVEVVVTGYDMDLSEVMGGWGSHAFSVTVAPVKRH